jgi:hypothetical protein
MSKIEIDLEFGDADDLVRHIEIIQAIVNVKRIQEEKKELERIQRNYKKSPKKHIMDTILELDENVVNLDIDENSSPEIQSEDEPKSDKVKCECGIDVLPKNKKRHLSSKTHTNFIATK